MSKTSCVTRTSAWVAVFRLVVEPKPSLRYQNHNSELKSLIRAWGRMTQAALKLQLST